MIATLAPLILVMQLLVANMLQFLLITAILVSLFLAIPTLELLKHLLFVMTRTHAQLTLAINPLETVCSLQ
jgi:hypothetical protein